MASLAPAIPCLVFGLVILLVILAPARDARADEPETPASQLSPPSPVPGPIPSPNPASAVGPAMTPEAQAHYDRGLQLYAARKFAAAISELEQGFKLDPRPEFLFAEAQAFRLSANCARAIPLYQRFLQSGPSPIQVQATQLALDRCGPGRTVVATPPPSPAAIKATVPSTREPPRWWRDTWALASIGTGVVALGVGGGFAVASGHARDDANSARTTTYSAFDGLYDTAERRRTIAVTSLIGGGVLVAAGTLRLLLRRRSDLQDGPPERRVSAQGGSQTSLSVAAGSGGGGLVWQGVY